ncbi:copper resistance protein CopC [Rhodococcus baikonurensis]
MRRAMVVLLVAAGCALISAGTAQAHSALVGSTPSADAVLDTAPSSVELVFNQEIQTSFANVTVSAADGTQVGAGEPSVQGERVSLVTTGQMSSGTYTVGYRVISEDGHPITGSYSFTLNAATNNAAPLPEVQHLRQLLRRRRRPPMPTPTTDPHCCCRFSVAQWQSCS